MNVAQYYTEAAYALVVAGAAWIYPPLALLAAAGFLGFLAFLDWRNPEVKP